MPTDKEKEVIQWDSWLLEAVRKIRTQKQRPGLDRIYNAVRLLAEKQEQAEHSQKSPIAPIYHVTFNQVKIEQVQRHLDRAVRKGLLLKVYSKGLPTFKSVEKSERTLNLAPAPIGASASTSGENGGASGELSKCILKVIRELSECDAPVPTSSSVTVSSTKVAKLGYTFETIEEYVRHSHVIIYPDEREDDFLPNLVRQALTKEVARGKLELVGGEHYRLPSSSTVSQGTPSSASSSSQGKKDKSQNPSTTSLSSSNSNSSWSSSSSSKSLTKTNTFAAAVNKPVKSAPIPPSPSQGTPTLTAVTTAPLIKKDGGAAGKAVKSGEQISTSPPSNSPPRPNLNPDLSEAEEIALVTEQTARAVMLVMKDRKPGEKPPPSSSSSSSSGGSSPKQKKSTPSPEPVIVEPIEAIPKQPSPAHSSASEDEKTKGKEPESSSSSRRSSLTGETTAPAHKNGNGTAIIKLMVPAFPGRNGGNGNGNPKGVVNKPPTPPLTSNATPAPTVSQGSKGVMVTATEKNPKTSGAVEANISSAASASVAPITPAATTSTASKGSAKSISNIASVIMNKKTNEVEGGGGAKKSRSKNKKAPPSTINPVEDVQESKDNICTNIIEGSTSSSSLEEGEYVVEKLVDKQEDVNGHVFYLVKWQGYADENNTWESEEKFVKMKDLIQEYENGVAAAAVKVKVEEVAPQEPEPDEGFDDEVPTAGGSIELPTLGTAGNEPKKDLPKARVGFGRRLKAKKILGALEQGGELCFLMEWKGSPKKDVVPAREANVKCPQVVIKWYESQINWSRQRTLEQMLERPGNDNQP